MLLVYGAGLKIVSGERIWTEVKKTLAGNYAGELFLTMLAVGIGRITSNTSHLPVFRNRIKHIFQMTVDGKISELNFLYSRQCLKPIFRIIVADPCPKYFSLI